MISNSSCGAGLFGRVENGIEIFKYLYIFFRKSLFYFCNAVVNEIVLDSIETIFCARLKSLVPLCSQSLVSMWDSSSSKCSPGFSFMSLIVTQLLLVLIAFDQCQSCPCERLCCIY